MSVVCMCKKNIGVRFQLANHLAVNFRYILIPALPVGDMVKREKRKLRKKTVKKMISWSHYMYSQRLKKFKRYPWCEV